MKLTLFFVMVDMHEKGWTRVGLYYPTRQIALRWATIARRRWHGLPTRVRQFTFFVVDGHVDERARRILSEKFNMDAP